MHGPDNPSACVCGPGYSRHMCAWHRLSQGTCMCGVGYPSACVHGPGYPSACVCGPGYPSACVCGPGYPRACVRGPGYPSACVRGPGYPSACVHGAGYPSARVRGTGYPRACVCVTLVHLCGLGYPSAMELLSWQIRITMVWAQKLREESILVTVYNELLKIHFSKLKCV